jgi:hypothetical protein
MAILDAALPLLLLPVPLTCMKSFIFADVDLADRMQ